MQVDGLLLNRNTFFISGNWAMPLIAIQRPVPWRHRLFEPILVRTVTSDSSHR